MTNNNYQISKWQNIWNKTLYGWDLNLINTDYSLVVDVSHYEYDPFKFDPGKFKAKAREMNLKALIFKLSDANIYTKKQWYDSSAEFWYQLAMDCGLLTSGYHWLQAVVDPMVAYKFYSDWIKDHPFSLSKIVDFEETSTKNNPVDFYWRLKTFLEASGEDTINYTSVGYLGDLRVSTPSGHLQDSAFMSKYSTWIAWYKRSQPELKSPLVDWIGWQYSPNGDFPFYQDQDSDNGLSWGMPGAGLDMSWFRNSYLNKFSPDTNPAPTPSGDKYVTLINSMRVREGPGVGYAQVGTLPIGTEILAQGVVIVNPVNDTWVKIGDKRFVCCTQQNPNLISYLRKE